MNAKKYGFRVSSKNTHVLMVNNNLLLLIDLLNNIVNFIVNPLKNKFLGMKM